MKKILLIIFLGVFLAALQGCGSQNIGQISADKESFLQKEIKECPETIDLAVAFQNDLNQGTHNYFKIYDNLKCQNKTVIDRAVRAAVLDNESGSKKYIDDNLKKAGIAYYSDGTPFDLSIKYPNEYLPVNYINDNLQTYEEAIKDLQEMEKSYPDRTDEEKPKDVKVLLVYNANKDYWDNVFNLMKDNQNDLSWQLMWKAYNYGDDSEVDGQIKDYFRTQGIDNYTQGDIEYTKENFYDLRLKFYYNDLDFSHIDSSDKNVLDGIKAVYDKYKDDNATRLITITDRSGGFAFNEVGEKPNICNTKLHTGYVIDEELAKSGPNPTPEIFVGIKTDPLYRYVSGIEGNVPADNSSQRGIDISSGDGLASFQGMYLSDTYKVIVNYDLLKYFSKDNLTVLHEYLKPDEKVTTSDLFNDISQIMLSRTQACLPGMGFYMNLDPTVIDPDEPDRHILAFSLDDAFSSAYVSKFTDLDKEIESLPSEPTQEQLDKYLEENRRYIAAQIAFVNKNKSTEDNITKRIYMLTDEKMKRYTTTKDQIFLPATPYSVTMNSHGTFIHTYLNFNGIDNYKYTLSVNGRTSIGLKFIDPILNQGQIEHDYPAVEREDFFDNFGLRYSGTRTATIHFAINGEKEKGLPLLESRLNGAKNIYYPGENFKYESSIIKTLKIGKYKYYGFYITASLLPTSGIGKDLPNGELRHFAFVIREDADKKREMYKLALDVDPKDNQRGDIAGNLVLDNSFNLFSLADDSEGKPHEKN